jgi:UDP-glucose 4-epimerase
MQQTILVTGGFGFLGRAVAQKFKKLGYRVIGIGHSQWNTKQALSFGYDVWLETSVSLSSLMSLDDKFNLVVHCAGSSSVGYSLTNPLQDFSLNVLATAELLEFLRITESEAMLIYPSSAGVYGICEDVPIHESDNLNPISPYGYHKKIIEEMLDMHSKIYKTHVAIIRFFSIYGPYLKKQLLWDASTKFLMADKEAVFWGSGEETRDWIYIDDAVELISKISNNPTPFILVNGASGDRITVKSVLEMLRDALGVDIEIKFNGTVRSGDPSYYHADISKLREMGMQPKVMLNEGIVSYVDWIKTCLK